MAATTDRIKPPLLHKSLLAQSVHLFVVDAEIHNDRHVTGGATHRGGPIFQLCTLQKGPWVP